MISASHGHHGGSVPVRFGILQKGQEAFPIEVGFLRKLAQLDESRINVDQTHGLITYRAGLGDSGRNDDEGHVIGFFPERELYTAFLVSQMVSMI